MKNSENLTKHPRWGRHYISLSDIIGQMTDKTLPNQAGIHSSADCSNNELGAFSLVVNVTIS